MPCTRNTFRRIRRLGRRWRRRGSREMFGWRSIASLRSDSCSESGASAPKPGTVHSITNFAPKEWSEKWGHHPPTKARHDRDVDWRGVSPLFAGECYFLVVVGLG